MKARRFWLLVLISLLPAMTAILAASWLMVIGACSAWLICLFLLGTAFHATVRLLRRRSADTDHASKSRLALTVVVAIGLFVTYTVLNLQSLRAMREVSMAMVCRANMYGIITAISGYAETNGAYPPTLQCLVAGERLSFRSLQSPFDSERPENPGSGGDTYTSYEYRPGVGGLRNDAHLLLVFEREPMTPLGFRLFPGWARSVLFDDGRFEILDEVGFRNALQDDARRRRELGWCPSETASSFPASSQEERDNHGIDR